MYVSQLNLNSKTFFSCDWFAQVYMQSLTWSALLQNMLDESEEDVNVLWQNNLLDNILLIQLFASPPLSNRTA